MKFYIEKLTHTNDIEKIVNKGEDLLFFMGQSFSFSMQYTQETISGKNLGKKTEMIETMYFSYVVDFDFYEKKLNLSFSITSPDKETDSFCFFSKVNQSEKSFQKKNIKLKFGFEMVTFQQDYRMKLSSETNDITQELNWLKKEIIDSIDKFKSRIQSIKELNKSDSDDYLQLDNEIKQFKYNALFFVEEKIKNNFSESINLCSIDYKMNQLEKTLDNSTQSQPKKKI